MVKTKHDPLEVIHVRIVNGLSWFRFLVVREALSNER